MKNKVNTTSRMFNYYLTLLLLLIAGCDDVELSSRDVYPHQYEMAVKYCTPNGGVKLVAPRMSLVVYCNNGAMFRFQKSKQDAFKQERNNEQHNQ